jgi:hypothetical protein
VSAALRIAASVCLFLCSSSFHGPNVYFPFVPLSKHPLPVDKWDNSGLYWIFYFFICVGLKNLFKIRIYENCNILIVSIPVAPWS